jgi:hypothetical protein
LKQEQQIDLLPQTSQKNTTTLDLTYTVQEGDVSADLDYTATNAFTLLGDANNQRCCGNDAVLTLPAVGGASSIAGQKAIVIDGVRPTVTSIAKQTPASQKTNVNSVTGVFCLANLLQMQVLHLVISH